MSKALSARGDLVGGVVTTDFETVLLERKQVSRIMKRDDATDMIGIEYNETNITKKLEVNLLKVSDQFSHKDPSKRDSSKNDDSKTDE